MLVVIATLTGRPDKREELAAALAKAAANGRGDAGCLSFRFTRDLEDQDSYVSVETWADQASLDAHFISPHMAEFMSVAGELFAGPPVIDTYETADR